MKIDNYSSHCFDYLENFNFIDFHRLSKYSALVFQVQTLLPCSNTSWSMGHNSNID